RPEAAWPVLPAKPLSQKLGVKPGFRIFTDSSPRPCREIVGELPDGTKILSRMTAPVDIVHLFTTEAAGRAGKLRSLRKTIAPDGMIRVSWPKKASGVATDLSDVWRCARPHG